MKKSAGFWSILAAFPILLVPNLTLAQIVPDATLPVNSQVTFQEATDLIEGGTTRGTHLFHSFSEFSIPSGRTAHFDNAPNIQTIFTRITGNSISEIDGLIRANGTADLFLLNPNGIVFGPNAALDIGGSFLGTTADSVQFADGFEFSASNPQVNPLLSVTVPVGLQIGTNHPPGTIQVQGANLTVKTGETLGLLGGDLTIAGNGNPLETSLTAGGFPLAVVDGISIPTTPGGRIELGSILYGSVAIDKNEHGFSLNYSELENLGNIQLINGATLNTSGTGSGEIAIQGRFVRFVGSRILSLNTGNLPGENIRINATESFILVGTGNFVERFQQLARINSSPVDFQNGIYSVSFGSGDSGNILIESPRVFAEKGAFIASSTTGAGQGGSISVNALQSVEMNASAYLSGNRLGSTGNAGDIRINAGSLRFTNLGLALAGTAGSGDGGIIEVNVIETAEFIGTNEFLLLSALNNTGLSTATLSNANSGGVRLTAKRMVFRDGAAIGASNFNGTGAGGNIEVLASESIEFDGASPTGLFRSGLYARGGGTGRSGNVSVVTDMLSVRNGALITVGGIERARAGNIEISATFIALENDAILTASAQSGDRGNIFLDADNIQLRGNSVITTNATGDATGGNISIRTQTLTALENSDISANSVGSFGGQVNINAQGIFGTQFRPFPSDQTSDITATSERGAEFSGIVTLNTPGLDPTAALVPLETSFLDPSGQIATDCQGNENSFTVVGRGGIPGSPTDPFSETRILTDLGSSQHERSITPQSRTPTATDEYLEATQWQRNERGQVILVAARPNRPKLDATCAQLSGSSVNVP